MPATSLSASDAGLLNSDKQGIRVTAIVVTYNPDLDVLSQSLQILRDRLQHIVIVDNASGRQADIARLCGDIRHFLLPSNLGLGCAHNIGIEFARSVDSTHVLLLDQDSVPDHAMISEMSKSVRLLESKNTKYCGLGCRYHLQEDSSQASNFVRISWFRFSRIHCNKKPYVAADFLISSGTLIPLSAIDQVGLMDESLFIDHIDTEWFLRARSMGFQAYGCCNAYMKHDLGEKTTTIWFLRSRQVPYHQPFRYYYIFRNSLLLYRRGYMSKKWMLADMVRLIQCLIFFGFLSRRRMDNLKMMWKGCLDGIKGVRGRCDRLINESE